MIIIKILYFLLPAYFSNMAPIIFRRAFNFLALPLDFGKTLGGNRLFGENKTIRGFVAGVILAIFIAGLQKILYLNFDFFKEISLINFSSINFILVGFLLGFGALFGDLFESFIKRRIGKKPSEPWKFFDQTDYIVGALFFIYPIYRVDFLGIMIALIFSFFLTVITNHLSYAIKARDEKW